jgi:peptidoglycan/LPS O-acetylase OafA/YrhL
MPFMNPDAHIRFPGNLVLAFTAAAASYYLLEQPMLRLRSRLKQRQGKIAARELVSTNETLLDRR